MTHLESRIKAAFSHDRWISLDPRNPFLRRFHILHTSLMSQASQKFPLDVDSSCIFSVTMLKCGFQHRPGASARLAAFGTSVFSCHFYRYASRVGLAAGRSVSHGEQRRIAL